MNDHSWKQLSSKIVYKSRYVIVKQDQVIRPDGKETLFDVVVRNDFVVVIAKKDEKFILVDQYRYPVKKRSVEFTEGSIDKGENPLDAAQRELIEEAGLESTNWKQLGYLYLGNGSHTQGFYVFLAEQCFEGKRIILGDEADLIRKEYSLEEVKKLIIEGKIHDAPTVAAWCYYLLGHY
jgi:8-oxo-dGTP pyrophosphatase MutT (NUDIX family)